MHLKHIGAVAAAIVVTMVAASISVGAMAAWAVTPAPPTVHQLFTPWATSTTQPQMLQGSLSDLGAPFVERIDVFSSSDGGASYQPYCSDDMVPQAGLTVWFCDTYTGTLASGDNLLAASATNPDGTSALGPPITITVVDAPTITSPATGLVTNNPTPEFTGTAIGTDVTVYIPGLGYFCSGLVVGGAWSCTAAATPDGTYSYFAEASPFSATGNSSTTNTITIDTTPPPLTAITAPAGPVVGGTMTATTNIPQPTISGTGEAGASVTVYRDYSPASCTIPTVVTSGGSWSCTLATPLAPGSYMFGSIQTDVAGNPSTTGSPDPQLLLTVTAPPPAPAVAPGAAQPTPPPSATPETPEGEEADAEETAEDPESVQPPAEEETGGADVTVERAFATGAATDPGLDRNDPAAPTALTEALPTIQHVVANPLAVAAAGALAVVLLLLVAIPSELLSATLASHSGRFGGFFAWADKASDRATTRLAELFRTPAVPATVLITAASIIFGFVDPAFGFDLASLRLVLGVGIGLFVLTYVASRLSGWIIRRTWSVESGISMQPAGLVFAVLGVVVARILEFSPGFLVGLVIGLQLAASTPPLRRIRSILVQLGVIVGIALAAWLGYSLTLALSGEATFASLLLQETLVALTAEGLTGALVALLPLGLLDGKEIFDRSRLLWAGGFLVVGTAFALVVLPTGIGLLEVEDLGVWVLVLLGFAALTVTLQTVLRFTGKAVAADSEADQLVDSTTER